VKGNGDQRVVDESGTEHFCDAPSESVKTVPGGLPETKRRKH